MAAELLTFGIVVGLGGCLRVFGGFIYTKHTEATMDGIKIGTNFTIFLLFFGVAALEAFQTRNWAKAAFWLAIGIVFLIADRQRKLA
jgi:hypothetical protein